MCSSMSVNVLAAASLVTFSSVSSSDVTPTDSWLNVWCIWHTYLETLQECQSRRRIGWILQDFYLETKMLWRQTPSRKKKAVMFTTVATSAYLDQLNAGFSKVCEILKARVTESLKYSWEFYRPDIIVVTFPRPKRDNEIKWTVIGYLTWVGLF